MQDRIGFEANNRTGRSQPSREDETCVADIGPDVQPQIAGLTKPENRFTYRKIVYALSRDTSPDCLARASLDHKSSGQPKRKDIVLLPEEDAREYLPRAPQVLRLQNADKLHW